MSAQNQLRRYGFLAESTFGVTPGTPTIALFEVSSFDGDMVAQQLSDPSIRQDRMVSFSRRGNTGTEGTMEVALCATNYDPFLEATLGGTWTANVLNVGNTARSILIEEGFMDTAQFRVFNGVTFNTLQVTVTPEALVTAQFGFLGSSVAPFAGTSITASPTAITARDKFFHEGGTIQEGGVGVANITGITLNYSNNLTGNYALGNSTYRSMSMGRSTVTGTVTALVENGTLYNKFRNSTNSSLSFQLNAGANSQTWLVPAVRYTFGRIVRADGGPVLVELGFEGIRDSVTGTNLRITRV